MTADADPLTILLEMVCIRRSNAAILTLLEGFDPDLCRAGLKITQNDFCAALQWFVQTSFPARQNSSLLLLSVLANTLGAKMSSA